MAVRAGPVAGAAATVLGGGWPSMPMSEAAASERARLPAKSANVGKYVFEEDRGSPMLMVLLALIIVVAVGVILYSFKVF
mgnify:CR=1 FL=1